MQISFSLPLHSLAAGEQIKILAKDQAYYVNATYVPNSSQNSRNYLDSRNHRRFPRQNRHVRRKSNYKVWRSFKAIARELETKPRGSCARASSSQPVAYKLVYYYHESDTVTFFYSKNLFPSEWLQRAILCGLKWIWFETSLRQKKKRMVFSFYQAP